MTAEIAILNKVAVALAADSAVTVSGQETGDSLKVYDTANKLFTLSKHHPVGVMLYGGAEILGMPWEIIIKEYRAQLSAKCFDRLEEYATDFLNYVVGRATDFFPANAQENFIKAVAQARLSDLAAQLQELAQEKGIDIGIPQEVRPHILPAIKKMCASVEQRPYADGFSADDAAAVAESYSSILDELLTGPLAAYFTKAARVGFRKLVALSLVKPDFSAGHSGIVVAGYGAADLFPAARCYLFTGVAINRVLVSRCDDKCTDISIRNPATVIPFAQDDMACLFMEGIDRSFHRFLLLALQESFSKLPSVMVGALSGFIQCNQTQLESVLQGMVADALKTVSKESSEYMWKEHIGPIIDSVGLLSKDELAVMAETMINLTAFKRKMTLVPETVGGPTDVAVISRGDGFIWVKRKHCFEPSLNHHFFANYCRCAEN